MRTEECYRLLGSARSVRHSLRTVADILAAVALQPFFDAMHRALKPGGVVCTQVGCPHRIHLF